MLASNYIPIHFTMACELFDSRCTCTIYPLCFLLYQNHNVPTSHMLSKVLEASASYTLAQYCISACGVIMMSGLRTTPDISLIQVNTIL